MKPQQSPSHPMMIHLDSAIVMARFFLGFSILCLMGGSATADDFDCYLLAGQSNMDGRGLNSDLPEDLSESLDNAIVFYSNPPLFTEDWQPLQPGFSRPPRYKEQLPSPKFGPEIGFVGELKRQYPTRRIAIIKASEGGTNLRSDWAAGESGDETSQGRCYRNLVRTIKDATSRLEAKGHSWTIRGMLWHQGESDSKANTDIHQQRLMHLIRRIRADCISPDLPVVLGQVVDNGSRDSVRAAIEATASTLDRVEVVDVNGLTTWDAGTHFDAGSQLLLGQRFAQALLNPQVAAKVPPRPVVCVGDSITRKGYPEILATLIDREVINAGVGGHTSRQGVRRFEKDVLDHTPQIVVILFGTNDMRVDSSKHVPIEDYKKQLTVMVQKCRKIGAEVILCTVPPINPEPYFTRHKIKNFEDAGGLPFLVEAYGQAVRDLAKENGLQLLDLYSLLDDDWEWMSVDGVHPGEAGNSIIAEHVADAIRQIRRK